jgi:hypothetical protein
MARSYLSQANTYMLLTLMKQMIVQQRYEKCSITAGETYDSSKKEATVLLLRYVEIDNYNNCDARPDERLTDVFTSGDSSGIYLCDKLF